MATLKGDRISIPTATSNPSSPVLGDMYYNSNDGTVKFYDGSTWISTNLVPVVNSVGGTMYSGLASTVTLSVAKTTDLVDIQWRDGSNLLVTSTAIAVSSGSVSVAVPAEVYGRSAGSSINATILNADGTPSSNTGQWTVQALPSGGTVTTYGNYRSHTFTSSGTFNTNGNQYSVDAMILAGGGGGGVDCAAGAGAGGCIIQTGLSVNGSYPIGIGAGGSGRPGPSDHGPGNRGSNTTALGYTASGGGAPQGWANSPGGMQPGGSGAGQSGSGTAGNPGGIGSGTPGQGNPGGSWGGGQAGGGGGKGSSGGPGSGPGNNGGDGINNDYRTGSNIGYARGGTGGIDFPGGIRRPGAGSKTSTPFNNSQGAQPAAAANTGDGGHGGNHNNQNGGSGGSGIVVIRYQL